MRRVCLHLFASCARLTRLLIECQKSAVDKNGRTVSRNSTRMFDDRRDVKWVPRRCVRPLLPLPLWWWSPSSPSSALRRAVVVVVIIIISISVECLTGWGMVSILGRLSSRLLVRLAVITDHRPEVVRSTKQRLLRQQQRQQHIRKESPRSFVE